MGAMGSYLELCGPRREREKAAGSIPDLTQYWDRKRHSGMGHEMPQPDLTLTPGGGAEVGAVRLHSQTSP